MKHRLRINDKAEIWYNVRQNMTELDKKLAKAARECSADAVRRTFEAGLTITILVGDRIVRRWPDGREELVKKLPPQ